MDRQWFTRITTRALSVIAGGALACLPLAASAESPHRATTGSLDRPRRRPYKPPGSRMPR